MNFFKISNHSLRKYTLMTLLALNSMGCTSLHQVGTLYNYDSVKEKERKSQKALNIATRDSIFNQQTQQILALQIVATHQITSDGSIDHLLSFLQNQPPSTQLYQQSIWTIGELSRSLDWNASTQQIHQVLLQEIRYSRNTTDISYLIDACIKNYVGHIHSIEEDVQTLEVLHELHSFGISLPSSLAAFQNHLQTLPVLVQLIQNTLDMPQRDQQHLYTSTLELMRYFESHRAMLSHAQYQKQIEDTLQTTLLLLDKGQQPVQLLTLWMLANNAKDDLLSEVVINHLLNLVQDSNNASVNILLHYALLEMRTAPQVREYFRQRFSNNQKEYLWDLLLQSNRRDLDIIQELYGVELSYKTEPRND